MQAFVAYYTCSDLKKLAIFLKQGNIFKRFRNLMFFLSLIAIRSKELLQIYEKHYY